MNTLTIAQALAQECATEDKLSQQWVYDRRNDAEYLLCHVLQKNRAWLISHSDDVIEPQVLHEFQQLLKRRAAGEPIAYLTGTKGFWNLDLCVTPATLIPRADTEVLVEVALSKIPPDSAVTILDLGTGTGAIALALAQERPRAQVHAVDYSVQALAVAAINVQRAGLKNVELQHSDWFSAVGDHQYDCIVANPPYIEKDDPHLSQGDLRFEPMFALVSGVDGLRDLNRICQQAPKYLKNGAYLILEHGWQQGGAVRQLLLENGFSDIQTVLDLEQRERVSYGRSV